MGDVKKDENYWNWKLFNFMFPKVYIKILLNIEYTMVKNFWNLDLHLYIKNILGFYYGKQDQVFNCIYGSIKVRMKWKVKRPQTSKEIVEENLVDFDWSRHSVQLEV